ncbi:unnamed protein product, partial [Amoebophrya sp. A120]|eukprot:GSA120T00005882001.1
MSQSERRRKRDKVQKELSAKEGLLSALATPGDAGDKSEHAASVSGAGDGGASNVA